LKRFKNSQTYQRRRILPKHLSHMKYLRMRSVKTIKTLSIKIHRLKLMIRNLIQIHRFSRLQRILKDWSKSKFNRWKCNLIIKFLYKKRFNISKNLKVINLLKIQVKMSCKIKKMISWKKAILKVKKFLKLVAINPKTT
jgi:hypothetical protein